MRCRAKESYICIIFFAFGFDMTTPNSLNKQMMSSWSITPNQRRNAQNYKTDMGTASFTLLLHLRSNVSAQISGDTEYIYGCKGYQPAALYSASCLAINKSKEWLPRHSNLEKTHNIPKMLQGNLISLLILKSV